MRRRVNIAGVLLAAGKAVRFGSDKRLHRLPDGTPMALAAARRLRAACPRTIIVLRPGPDPLRELLALEPVEIAETAGSGVGDSIAAGIRASHRSGGPAVDGWLIALADMPYIAEESYACVLQALAQGAAIARPVHAGCVGHPVGFRARYRDALVALAGDQGARSIIEAEPGALVTCAVQDPGVLVDVDRPGDLRMDAARPPQATRLP